MGVQSLWKVLDRAGGGAAVGVEQLASKSDIRAAKQTNNPRYYDELRAPSTDLSNRVTLAVDLSIWICESLTSHAMRENHANPSLNLVFSRTIKLLSLGIKLIFVIEGKRRIQGEGAEADKFYKRRSGTNFSKACSECQQMLQHLGVIVVKARAEGEALCALLSQRGVVDGVISNDGDCLLFGAKIVYTKFSLENLEKGQVIRYDLDNLRAVIEPDDDKDIPDNELGSMKLSRDDLIAFALLTGSDLAGGGLYKVGHKKAVRFIRKCQLDFPLSVQTAAIDELKAWARSATNAPAHVGTETESGKCCSRCCHSGSKRDHQKHGCDACGTEPGEPCFQLTSDDKFCKCLRAKALALVPKFDPTNVVAAYKQPNGNQMPIQLVNKTSADIRMLAPNLRGLLLSRFIIKGRALQPSNEHVQQSVARLMSRIEMFQPPAKSRESDISRQKLSCERPVPQRITKTLIQNQIPCYEIAWTVGASISDGNGEGVNGYEYSTVEHQELFEKRYPDFVKVLKASFQEVEKERMKQGDGEQNRRRDFVVTLFGGSCEDIDKPPPVKKPATDKRDGFFHSVRQDPFGVAEKHRKKQKTNAFPSDDVANLLGAHASRPRTLNMPFKAPNDDHMQSPNPTTRKQGHIAFACMPSKEADTSAKDVMQFMTISLPEHPLTLSPLTTNDVSDTIPWQPHPRGRDECDLLKRLTFAEPNAGSQRVLNSEGHHPLDMLTTCFQAPQSTHQNLNNSFLKAIYINRESNPAPECYQDVVELSQLTNGDPIDKMHFITETDNELLEKRVSFRLPATPDSQSLFCHLGGVTVQITPIVSNGGAFPPRHVFARKNLYRLGSYE
jgi:5'-3' exonuclease